MPTASRVTRFARSAAGAASFLLTVAVVGCFRYEQTVVVRADGTADITISYAVPAVIAAPAPAETPEVVPDAPKPAERPAPGGPALIPTAPAYEEEAAALRSRFTYAGFEVAEARVFDEGEMRTYRVRGRLVDPGAADEVLGFLGDHRLEVDPGPDSVEVVEVVKSALGESARPTDEETALLETLFPDCGFTFRLVLPGRVKETNGTVGADGQTVEWRYGLTEFLFAKKMEMRAKGANE